MVAFFEKREPLFLKKSSGSERELEEMRLLLGRVSSGDWQRLERDIKLAEAEVRGERKVAFELANSHLPIIVLRDLRLEHAGHAGRIDFLIVTPYVNMVVECKSLVGTIAVSSKGVFTRTFRHGGRVFKGEIDSPIELNRLHLEMMEAIREADDSATRQAAYERPMPDFCESVVVLANPKAVLDDRFARAEDCRQIIRVDALANYLSGVDAARRKVHGKRSWEEMGRIAQYWFSKHVERPADWNLHYRLRHEFRAGAYR